MQSKSVNEEQPMPSLFPKGAYHDVIYRAVTLADQAFLVRLRVAVMSEHLHAQGLFLNEAQHLERVRDHYWHSKIICVEDKPVGVIKVVSNAHKAHIMQIQLLAEAQGRGIGTLVINTVKQQAFKQGLYVSLNVLKNNKVKALYKKLGFTVIKEQTIDFYLTCYPTK